MNRFEAAFGFFTDEGDRWGVIDTHSRKYQKCIAVCYGTDEEAKIIARHLALILNERDRAVADFNLEDLPA